MYIIISLSLYIYMYGSAQFVTVIIYFYRKVDTNDGVEKRGKNKKGGGGVPETISFFVISLFGFGCLVDETH